MDGTMPAVFSTSTKITILFTGWTTTTIPQYLLTLTFLFILAILNRFLGALKYQLEQSWSKKDTLYLPRVTKYQTRKAKLSPLQTYTRIHVDDEEEEQSLPMNELPDRPTPLKNEMRRRRCILPSWKASAPWGLQRDGVYAVLECTRAAIGYFL
ncbi:Ctr copper transporter [Penicillium sp. DV-2018c]|nr:Ctr copper transporter [Penicillium sp. DV-2018c]